MGVLVLGADGQASVSVDVHVMTMDSNGNINISGSGSGSGNVNGSGSGSANANANANDDLQFPTGRPMVDNLAASANREASAVRWSWHVCSLRCCCTAH